MPGYVDRITEKYETDPVSETLCFLSFRVMDDGQSPKTQYFQRISRLGTDHHSDSLLLCAVR
jgi:hypothetical protein